MPQTQTATPLSNLSDDELKSLAQSRGISMPAADKQQAPALSDLSDDELKNLATSRGIAMPDKVGKQGGIDWNQVNQGAKSFAGNILPGLAELPEQAVNAYQAYGRSQANMPGGSPPLSQWLSNTIPNLNEKMGQPPTPYLDVTGALRNMPLPGSVFQGQTPNQLALQNPTAAGFGSATGQLPYFSMLGGPAAVSKLPLAGRIAATALGFGGLNAATSGLQEATDQAKSNDQIDWGQVGQGAYDSFKQGAIMGGAFGSFSKGAPKTPEVIPPTPPGAPPAAPAGPKLIEMKGPLVPPGPTEKLRAQGEKLFGRVENVPGELQPETSQPSGKATKTKTKQPEIKVSVPSSPMPPAKIVGDRVEQIVDPNKSWRGVRDDKARPATAQEAPLAKRMARLKVEVDADKSKLKGAIKEFYKLIGEKVPNRPQNIDPKLAEELKAIAKRLGGESKMRSYTEAVVSTPDKFPEEYNFKSSTPEGKMREIRDLDEKVKTAEAKYDRFKELNEENFSETLPLNETVQVNVQHQEHGNRAVNVTREWRASEYEFKDAKGETDAAKTAEYQQERETRRNQSQPYPELGTPTFKAVVQQVADRGDNLIVEGLADKGALDWFKSKPKGTQSMIIIAIATAAALITESNQQAQAAPPPKQLVGSVIKNLKAINWQEFMGSRPITRITQNELTTDMIRKGFDAGSKVFAQTRMNYIQGLKRANVGSRAMTDAERVATKGLRPWELRRTLLLPGWTQNELNKAGDIAALNQQYKSDLQNEMARLDTLKVKPGHFGGAARYRRGIDIDARDSGIGLDYDPIGRKGQIDEIANKLTGEIMQSEFVGNYRVMGLHILEALTAAISKYGPINFGEALHGIATSQVYKDFTTENAQKGFFQQRLESQSHFKYRQVISDAINAPIEKFIKSLPHGEVILQGLQAQLGERGKTGLVSVVIAHALAKNYPGGPEMYMKRWLDNARYRTPIPPNEQQAFSKIAIEAAIEENKATGFLPHGMIIERSVLQRNRWLGFLEPFSYGKLIQSRFFMSLADDFLEAVAKGDKQGMLRAAQAGVTASVMVGAISGSHAVSPFVWGFLGQIDRTVYGTERDVQALKDNIDILQKNWGPGYQIQKYGVSGLAFVKFPSTAIGDMWDRLIRDAHPKTKADVMRAVFDFTSTAFMSKVGPVGTMNLDYMLERVGRGLKGYEQFKQYESSPQGMLMDKVQGRPFATKLIDQKLKFDLSQGILHAFIDIENPKEVKAIRQADKTSSQNWQKDTRSYSKAWPSALKH